MSEKEGFGRGNKDRNQENKGKKGNESENSYTKWNQNYCCKTNHQCGYYTTFIHIVFFLFGISLICMLSTKGSETLRLARALGF